MSPRISFDHELKLLKENVSDMVNRVEENYEHLFDALKSQEEDEILKIKNNDKLINKQQREPKFSTRAYTRCRLCGRPHSVLRKYGVCRICFRELAYKGQIPGVRKASW